MKLGNGSEHLLLTALFYFGVRGDNRKAVFSVHVTSPNNGDISNVIFSRGAFQRFYNCLLSSGTCTIRYAQSYSKTHMNNVVHVRGSNQFNHQSANREKYARTTFCTKTRTGKLKCENKAHDKDNNELGVRPIWQCGNKACPCVYFDNFRQISYDNKDLQECPRKIQISSTFRRLRARRAARSSSRSSSRGRSRTYTGSRSSNSSSSYNSKVGMIVGITVGAIVFVCIVIAVVFYCINKHNSQNNVKENITTSAPCKEIEMADAAAEENGQNKSQFVFSETTPDTEFSKQNGDIFPVQTITDGNGEEFPNYEDTREANGKINVTGNEEYVGIRESEKNNVLIQY